MVRLYELAIVASGLLGLSNAAALGTAEEYADGTVHAMIMGMKMVSTPVDLLLLALLVIRTNIRSRHSGMLNSPRARWRARDIRSWGIHLVRTVSRLRSQGTLTTRSSATTFVSCLRFHGEREKWLTITD